MARRGKARALQLKLGKAWRVRAVQVVAWHGRGYNYHKLGMARHGKAWRGLARQGIYNYHKLGMARLDVAGHGMARQGFYINCPTRTFRASEPEKSSPVTGPGTYHQSFQ